MGAFLLPGPRRATSRIIAFGFLLLFCLITYTLFLSTPKIVWESLSNSLGSRVRGTCSPEAWANGAWVQKNSTTTSNVTMTSEDDALFILGFEGCASSREFNWHLGADRPEQWDRFPGVASYEWAPSSTCTDVQPLDREGLIRDMVENGGWLLIGGESPCFCEVRQTN